MSINKIYIDSIPIMHGCLQLKNTETKKKNSTANEYEILLNNNGIMQFIFCICRRQG